MFGEQIAFSPAIAAAEMILLRFDLEFDCFMTTARLGPNKNLHFNGILINAIKRQKYFFESLQSHPQRAIDLNYHLINHSISWRFHCHEIFIDQIKDVFITLFFMARYAYDMPIMKPIKWQYFKFQWPAWLSTIGFCLERHPNTNQPLICTLKHRRLKVIDFEL